MRENVGITSYMRASFGFKMEFLSSTHISTAQLPNCRAYMKDYSRGAMQFVSNLIPMLLTCALSILYLLQVLNIVLSEP